MEKSLTKCLEDIKGKPGVTGVICTDANGLTLSAVGDVNPQASGVVSNLSALASTIEPNSSRAPVITIESDKSQILITKEGQTSVGVFKSSSSYSM